MNFFVVYITPAGNTRHAARVISEGLSVLGNGRSA